MKTDFCDPVFAAFSSIIDQPVSAWARLVRQVFPYDLAKRQELERMLAVAQQEEIPADPDAGLQTKFPFLSRPEPIQEPPPEIPRVTLFEPVGSGSAGKVYRGVQASPVIREVAVKVFHRDSDAGATMRREAQTLAKLKHHGIASLHDAGTTRDGRAYAILEYVRGVPLTKWIATKRLTLGEVLELFLQICDAIAYAAEQGITHRDLKPSNILVEEDAGLARAVVLDFSIAGGNDLGSGDPDTLQGRAVGTPEYMSPEQADPQLAPMSTRSDVYALGLILFEILTGQHAASIGTRQRPSVTAVYEFLARSDPDPPSASLAYRQARRTEVRWSPRDLRGDLDAIVLRCLRRHPSERYPTAHEMRTDLRCYLAHQPIAARRIGMLGHLKRIARRQPAVATASASALLLLFVIAGISVLGYYGVSAAKHQQSLALRDTQVALANEALRRGDLRVAQDQLASVPVSIRNGNWNVLAAATDQSVASWHLDAQGIARIYQHQDTAVVIGESGSLWIVNLTTLDQAPERVGWLPDPAVDVHLLKAGPSFLITSQYGHLQLREVERGSWKLSTADKLLAASVQPSDDADYRLELDGSTLGPTLQYGSGEWVLLGHGTTRGIVYSGVLTSDGVTLTGDATGEVRVWRIPSEFTSHPGMAPWLATRDGWILRSSEGVALGNRLSIQRGPGIEYFSSIADGDSGVVLFGVSPDIRFIEDDVAELRSFRPHHIPATYCQPLLDLAQQGVWYVCQQKNNLQFESLDSRLQLTMDIGAQPIFCIANTLEQDGVWCLAGHELVRIRRDGCVVIRQDVPTGSQFLHIGKHGVLVVSHDGEGRHLSRDGFAVTELELASEITAVSRDDFAGLVFLGTSSGQAVVFDTATLQVAASFPMLGERMASIQMGHDGILRACGQNGAAASLMLRHRYSGSD